MILQALANYYDRLVNDPDQDVPEPGFSVQKIHAEIVLDRDGNLVAMNDIQQEETIPPKNNKGKPKTRIVPQMLHTPNLAEKPKLAKRSGTGYHPYFLWDNTGYVLGADNKDNPERAQGAFQSYRKHLHVLGDSIDDDGMRAVLRFIDSWHPERVSEIDDWEKFAGQNVVFRLDREMRYVHDRPAVRTVWVNYVLSKASNVEGICLVSGEQAPVALLHPDIKGVRGAQKKGAALSSYNIESSVSFGKKQNYNAPVSERAAFAYTTALNHLLAGDRQRMQLGDTTVVYWSEKPTPLEQFFQHIINPSSEAQEDSTEAHDGAVVGELRDLLHAVRDGREPPVSTLLGDDPETPFYVLGLTPNASRLAVRFWLVSTVSEIAERLAQHFADLEMERQFPSEPEFPGIWRLVRELAPARPNAEGRHTSKMDDVPPVYAGALARSVLTGETYPESIVNRILGRFRSDGQITYGRVALLAAHHRRALRRGRALSSNIQEPEVTVSLNPEIKNVGYRLGRLFAVLERAQQVALEDINATIKDRFFGSAMATPAAVFPRLISLGQHHFKKAKEKGRIFDKPTGEIMEGFEVADGKPPFPPHLSSDDQVMFALGYYHQRNALWRKKDAPAETPENLGAEEAA